MMADPVLQTENEENDNKSSDYNDDDEERKHYMRIINSFKYYRTFALRRVQDAEKNFDGLPENHKKLIPFYMNHASSVRDGIEKNCEVIGQIVQAAENIFENIESVDVNETEEPVKETVPLVMDMDKVKTTLKQFVRDWSESGQAERENCYDPVIKEIESRFPIEKCEPSTVYVLVPGAGLGRLAFELARRGYSCQGNEWSMHMLISSHFVLNKCKEINTHVLHPWIHQWTNNIRREDQLQPITFPDTNPSDLPENSNFSMAAGDFLEVYQEPESWDCVATVFFIDTAHNVIEYIQTIYKILKPGGYWVNLGPLLYHFSDMSNEMSIELSYTDLKEVIKQTGFVFEMEKMNVKSSYTQNPKSMLQYKYDSVFFVAKKPS